MADERIISATPVQRGIVVNPVQRTLTAVVKSS